MPSATRRRENACRVVPRRPARVETLEHRVLLHAGHEAAAPAALSASFEATHLTPAPAAILPASAPRLPDMVPLVNLAKGYVYGWEYDTKQFPGRTLLRLTTA